MWEPTGVSSRHRVHRFRMVVSRRQSRRFEHPAAALRTESAPWVGIPTHGAYRLRVVWEGRPTCPPLGDG